MSTCACFRVYACVCACVCVCVWQIIDNAHSYLKKYAMHVFVIGNCFKDYMTLLLMLGNASLPFTAIEANYPGE